MVEAERVLLVLMLAPTILALLGVRAFAVTDSVQSDAFVGWGGEQYAEVKAQDPEPDAVNDYVRWVETLSWSPRAFLFHNFLTHEECDRIIALAEPKLSRSQVVADKGGSTIDPIRTSYSAALFAYEDPLVMEVEKRIANWTHLHTRLGEPFEVLRYVNGQKYDAHWDWFTTEDFKNGAGQRVATVLLYLAEVPPDAGGETALPLAEPLAGAVAPGSGLSACASKMGIAVRPEKGAALLFWDMLPDGKRVDRAALHASCPTFKGTKWTCTKWIHAN